MFVVMMILLFVVFGVNLNLLVKVIFWLGGGLNLFGNRFCFLNGFCGGGNCVFIDVLKNVMKNMVVNVGEIYLFIVDWKLN